MSLHLYKIDGVSMSPILNEGDIVFVEEVQPSFLDLVAFKGEDNRVIIHRYFGKNHFKGDNLKRFDQEYKKNISIIGKVKKIKRSEKDIDILAFNPLWYKLFIFILSPLNHASLPYVHKGATLLIQKIGKKVMNGSV